MITRFKFIIIPFLILCLHGCEFTPDEVPETIISGANESGPPVLFSLNDFTDTIKIGWTTDFRYSITGTSNKIISVNVNIEGSILHNYTAGNSQSFSFTFNPSSYSDGHYNLHVEIITGSGTGSIADKVGAEGFLYELDWPVYIDKTLPVNYNEMMLKAVRSENGNVLTWPAFNHPNFNSYVLYRQNWGQLSFLPITEIKDPLTTSFIDSTFWEGQIVQYYLEIHTPAGNYRGNYAWVQNRLTGLQAKWHSDGTAYVTWDKARNLESFGKYYISSEFNNTTVLERYIIEDPDQNHVTLKNTGFGNGIYIYLKFIPKGFNENQYNYVEGISIPLHPEIMIPVHWSSFNVNDRDFILLANYDKIYRYYPAETRTADSISTKLSSTCMISVSGNGERFAYYDLENFYIRRTEDFVLEKQFPAPPMNLPTPWNPEYNKLAYYSLSDNGKLFVSDLDGITYLYNTNDGSLIRKDTLKIDGDPVRSGLLSSDGTKMIAHSSNGLGATVTIVVYSIDPDGWKEIFRVTSYAPVDLFYSKDGSSIYIIGKTQVEKRRVSDFYLISSYTLPEGYFQGADLDHERMLRDLGYTYQKILVDLNTGQIIRTMHLGFAGECTLFDNYIISSNGLQLTLPEF